MTSETLHAHWNPAFRPNSEKEFLVNLSLPSLALLEYNHSDEVSEEDVTTSEPGEEVTPGQTNERNLDERNLGSEEIQTPIPFDFLTHEINGRPEAEFRPGHKDISKKSSSRHDSTLSFARTISEEVTWTDDEIDPEWSSQRTDNEKLDFTSYSGQTNLPPYFTAQDSVREHLPFSQTEGYVDYIEPKTGDYLDKENNNTVTNFNTKISKEHRPYEGPLSDLSQNNFSQGHRGAEVQVEHNSSDSPPLIDGQIFRECGGVIEADRQSSVHQEQILNSQFQLQSTTLANESSYHVANEQTKISTENSSQENALTCSPTYQTNYIPTSSPESFKNSMNLEKIETTLESNSDDLAARWRAALADDMANDLFLDEDGLLPDDDEFNFETTPQKEIDPAILFGSDEEDFLLSTEDNFAVQEKNSHIPALTTNSNQNSSALSNEIQSYYPARNLSPGNIYVPTTSKAAEADLKAFMPQPNTNFPPPKSRRPEIAQAKSFVGMSKGGYSSPYDLPEDIAPRKRVGGSQLNHVTHPPSIMPRSSSLLNQSSSVPEEPSDGSNSQKMINGQSRSANAMITSQSSQGGFFEDLPPSKPKLTSRRSSAYSSNLKSINNQQTSNFRPETVAFDHHIPVPQHSQPLQTSGSQPAVSSFNPNQMVSPQIVSQTSIPQPGTRQYASVYAPPPTSAILRSHQPRTSSPLAYHELNQDDQLSAHHRTGNFDQLKSSFTRQHSMTSQNDENEQSSPLQTQISTPSTIHNLTNMPTQANSQIHSFAPKVLNSPLKRSFSSYPSQNYIEGAPLTFVPPQRSRTQSPGSAYPARPYNPVIRDSFQRPASVEPSFSLPESPYIHQSPQIAPPDLLGEKSGESFQTTPLVFPTDGRELDPLQRWKGSPIFKWGVGGIVVTSFPKDVPRYGMNQSTPLIFRVPGEIQIKSIKNIDPLSPYLAKFPGPLRGKSKKKEVTAWLTSGIEHLESQVDPSRNIFNPSLEEKRAEERVLLWKILRIFIEQDGNLEGTSVIEKTVRTVLSPNLDEERVADTPLYATGAELSGIFLSTKTPSQPEIIDSTTVGNLKKYLLLGQREKAVWEAVDKRLWAHAMLISHTVSQELYKQVAQEFIQKEVRVIGGKTQSLAALYEIFAGNFEESIDELVPPSARAGLQMVSTSSEAGPSEDGLNGLDGWRETLSLVLSNRSTEDTRALTALGKLLASYGRIEAAHICFLFARKCAVFSGIDDPLSTIVLVGSDHARQPHDFDRELEPVLLSEVFEYGMSLSNPASIVASSPHLSVYKLQHAKILAEYGARDKAIQYCEAIAASITSQTRRSSYHHNLLVSELDDLSQRLKQSPRDDSSSWISKPSIDKAKGSVWATFNKFVAGDDTDATEVTSDTGNINDAGSGPFARITRETPILNHPSSAEVPSFYQSSSGMGGKSSTVAQSASSRYAPSVIHTTGIQEQLPYGPYGSQIIQSPEGIIPNESRPYEPHRQNSQSTKTNYHPSQSVNPISPNPPPLNLNYSPQPGFMQQSLTPRSPETSTDANASATEQYPSILSPISFHQQVSQSRTSYSYKPLTINELTSPIDSGSQAIDFQPGSIPQTTTNFEPESPTETLPTEKLLTHDNNDLLVQESQKDANEKTRAEKDREADEAFRRAAEADAKKAQESTPIKRGWGLASWFGGGAKKEQAATTKPIRAKLGEESSFVYDPKLKRWINKKDNQGQAEKKSSMPPPPKGPGPPRPRNITALTPTPSSIISTMAVDSVAMNTPPGMARTASNSSVLPPSRPSTSMSNASSIDDLLGPPTLGRKTGARVKKKGRGYVDVMGDKAS